ncbi:MAG: tetratricopeptide repeat protein, partial [Deltaproteobacteria bacterium]|nr:tetratricopeptide repeat protein [Kofleriaceae bacterium]
MADQDHTGRWRRHERAKTVPDAIELLRRSVLQIRRAPDDVEVRRHVRAIAAEHELWEQLAGLLADEARAHGDRPEIAAVLYEELADVYHALDQPLETIRAMESLVAIAPDRHEHHERIAALYRQAGAWSKAADAFEEVAKRAPEQVARAALLDAARLHRENRSFERAAQLFRSIVERRPTDLLAWRALDDV